MGRGPGEILSAAPGPRFAAVLAMPGLGLSTPAVYAAFDRLPAPPQLVRSPPPEGLPALAAWVRNDLWPPALALAPALGATARALSAAGARASLLCGSGSCVAGLFPDRPAAVAAAAHLPGGALLAVVVPAHRGTTID